MDRKFGIASSGRRDPSSLGFSSPELVGYQPFSYRDLHEIFGIVPATRDDSLLDLGSGMGRAVCVAAATQPFRSVTGIEISPELCAIARRNLDRVRLKLQSRDVEILNCDVKNYCIPGHITILLMFNPFNGATLEAALRRVRESLEHCPRQVRLLFYGTVSSIGFRQAALAHSWLSFENEKVLSTGAVVLSYLAQGT